MSKRNAAIRLQKLMLRSSLPFLFVNRNLQSVKLNKILHNDHKTYVLEKYGRKKIVYWPFYYFIRLYLSGNCHDAKEMWINWLVNQFNKYKHVKKKYGGMLGGSVHREAAKMKSKDSNLINPDYLSI